MRYWKLGSTSDEDEKVKRIVTEGFRDNPKAREQQAWGGKYPYADSDKLISAPQWLQGCTGLFNNNDTDQYTVSTYLMDYNNDKQFKCRLSCHPVPEKSPCKLYWPFNLPGRVHSYNKDRQSLVVAIEHKPLPKYASSDPDTRSVIAFVGFWGVTDISQWYSKTEPFISPITGHQTYEQRLILKGEPFAKVAWTTRPDVVIQIEKYSGNDDRPLIDVNTALFTTFADKTPKLLSKILGGLDSRYIDACIGLAGNFWDNVWKNDRNKSIPPQPSSWEQFENGYALPAGGKYWFSLQKNYNVNPILNPHSSIEIETKQFAYNLAALINDYVKEVTVPTGKNLPESYGFSLSMLTAFAKEHFSPRSSAWPLDIDTFNPKYLWAVNALFYMLNYKGFDNDAYKRARVMVAQTVWMCQPNWRHSVINLFKGGYLEYLSIIPFLQLPEKLQEGFNDLQKYMTTSGDSDFFSRRLNDPWLPPLSPLVNTPDEGEGMFAKVWKTLLRITSLSDIPGAGGEFNTYTMGTCFAFTVALINDIIARIDALQTPAKWEYPNPFGAAGLSAPLNDAEIKRLIKAYGKQSPPPPLPPIPPSPKDREVAQSTEKSNTPLYVLGAVALGAGTYFAYKWSQEDRG